MHMIQMTPHDIIQYYENVTLDPLEIMGYLKSCKVDMCWRVYMVQYWIEMMIPYFVGVGGARGVLYETFTGSDPELTVCTHAHS